MSKAKAHRKTKRSVKAEQANDAAAVGFVKKHGSVEAAVGALVSGQDHYPPRTPEAEVREVKVNGKAVKMRFSDQSAECTHWWRLTGNKGTCKKCGVTRVFGKTDQATEETSEKILAYVKAHNGKKVEWRNFAQEVGVSQGRLGLLLRALIDDGTVTEVDHDNRPFVYRLARPKVSRRAA
jgi:hypothetical protein